MTHPCKAQIKHPCAAMQLVHLTHLTSLYAQRNSFVQYATIINSYPLYINIITTHYIWDNLPTHGQEKHTFVAMQYLHVTHFTALCARRNSLARRPTLLNSLSSLHINITITHYFRGDRPVIGQNQRLCFNAVCAARASHCTPRTKQQLCTVPPATQLPILSKYKHHNNTLFSG